jgi:hypothetical protein
LPVRRRLHTYTAYSVGCAIVWALIWAIVSRTADEDRRQTLKVAFAGWVSGWTSATIARSVYPPPKRHRN